MKLLVDMNLSPTWIGWLASAGIEAVHWSSVGPGDASDTTLMEWADRHGCIVLTSDLDFGAILAATGGRCPSVIQLRSENLSPDSIGKAVVSAIAEMQQELDEGALLSIDASRTRLKVLPLKM